MAIQDNCCHKHFNKHDNTINEVQKEVHIHKRKLPLNQYIKRPHYIYTGYMLNKYFND